MKDFFELFVTELKDAVDCERQIIKALPKMIDAATSPKLKDAFRHHLEETKIQLKRLEEISIEINEKLDHGSCEAIRGILQEGQKLIKEHYQSDVRDAALISAAQRVEHYEIALYGVLRTYAKHLKLKNVADLLDKTIKEEGDADKKLTAIAEGSFFSGGINAKACKRCA